MQQLHRRALVVRSGRLRKPVAPARHSPSQQVVAAARQQPGLQRHLAFLRGRYWSPHLKRNSGTTLAAPQVPPGGSQPAGRRDLTIRIRITRMQPGPARSVCGGAALRKKPGPGQLTGRRTRCCKPKQSSRPGQPGRQPASRCRLRQAGLSQRAAWHRTDQTPDIMGSSQETATQEQPLDGGGIPPEIGQRKVGPPGSAQHRPSRDGQRHPQGFQVRHHRRHGQAPRTVPPRGVTATLMGSPGRVARSIESCQQGRRRATAGPPVQHQPRLATGFAQAPTRLRAGSGHQAPWLRSCFAIHRA